MSVDVYWCTCRALGQLKALAGMVNQLSKGFLTITLAPHLRYAVAEADALATNAPEQEQVARNLLKAFAPNFKPSQNLLSCDQLTIGLLEACSPHPKVLLLDAGEKPPAWYQQVSILLCVSYYSGH